MGKHKPIKTEAESGAVSSTPELLRVSAAAKLVGLSVRTLLRAERDFRISFSRDSHGRRVVAREDLLNAQILTVGRAARVADVPYEQVRSLLRDRQVGGQIAALGLKAFGYLSWRQAEGIRDAILRLKATRIRLAQERKLKRFAEAQRSRNEIATYRAILGIVRARRELSNPGARRQHAIREHAFEIGLHLTALKGLGVDTEKLITGLGKPKPVMASVVPMQTPAQRRIIHLRQLRLRRHRTYPSRNPAGGGSQIQEILPQAEGHGKDEEKEHEESTATSGERPNR